LTIPASRKGRTVDDIGRAERGAVPAGERFVSFAPGRLGHQLAGITTGV
jgi:hypothetical protein